MLVRVRNLDIFERSIPTPVNTSIPIQGNETVEFTYPKAFDSFFMNLKKFNFYVECISQIGDVKPSNPNLDYIELIKLVKECYDLLTNTEVCNDNGIHVAPEDMWVTEDDHQALLAAYEYAISVNQETETQDEIDNAVEVLRKAKEAFEAARQYGIGVDETLPKVTQYGFSDSGPILETLLDLSDIKDNSFYFKLNKPLEEDTTLVATLTINEHKFVTEISVDRHPEFATRSVTTVGETIVWSFGTGISSTDIETVDGVSVDHFTSEWPVLPNTALLTIETSDGEVLRGVDERKFTDREIKMVRNVTDNHVVTELNFRVIDRSINAANLALEGIVTSELDGDDIEPSYQWVTPDQLSAFQSVIDQASSLKGVTENQLEINNAQSALDTALAVFESQKQYGKKGPFVLTTTLIEGSEAQDSEGTQLYQPGFNVEQSEQTIVAKGNLAFIESFSEDTRETHYHLPLHLTLEEGRVVVVLDIDDPEKELSHVVVPEEEFVDIFLAVDDEHRTPVFKVYRNEEAYNEKSEEWVQDYTVNCTLVTLAAELPYITGVSVPSGLWQERMYSELYDELVLALNNNRVTAQGTSCYIDKWEAAYGDEDVHWFVPAKFDGLKSDMVIKCFTRDDPENELKHYVVNDDNVLVTAISPTVKSRHIVVYRNIDNYEADERGQEYILDFSNVYLSADPDPIKSVTLMTEGGWKNKQYADLVAEEPAFEITKVNHTIKCTGEFVWTDWPELVGGNSGTHHFLPMRIVAADGLILSWYNTDTSPTETKHFTINDDTRDIVAQLTEGAPKKKIVIYTSMDAHNVQKDGVEYILDCSEVVFQPKPFMILPAADEDELKDALTQEPDYDGKVHIELTQEVELSDKLVLENPVELSGETTLTAPKGIVILADTILDDLTIETESENGITIDDSSHAPIVVMDNVTYNYKPSQAGADDKARGIIINSSAYDDPTVTIKDSTITATPLSGKSVRAIELASNSTVDGHGSLTLDHTSVETSGNGDTCIVLNSPNAEVVIENDSTVTNKDYEGILVGYNGSVTVDHSKVDAVEAFFIDSLAGCETKDATIEIKNESDIVSTNNWAPSGSNNTAVITIDNATNCTVHLDATSSIVATGGGTASNNEYVGALIGTKDNTIYLEGATKTENNVNQFWFIHSREDSDALLYDKAGNGDNLVIVGTAAAKAYVINKDTRVSEIALLSVPKSDTINVTNDLDTAVRVAQAAQQGVTTDKFIIDMGRFADDSGNDDIRMPEGVTFKGYSNYITIEPLKGTPVFDILPSNFQYDVQVLENGKTAQISGTLLDVDLAAFSNNPEFQEGHYLALKVSRNANVSRITLSSEFTGTVEKEVDADGIILLYIGPDKSKKITLNVYTTEGLISIPTDREELELKDELVTVGLDVMDIKFEDGSGTHYTDFFNVAPRTEDYWNKKMSDVQSKVEIHETTGMSVSLTGTLHYVDEWNEWNKGESGNFLVLDFTPVEGTTKLTFMGGQVKEIDDNVLAYKVTDPSETFMVVAEDDLGEHDVEFNLTGLVLEPKPEKLFTVSMPSSQEEFGNKKVSDLQNLTINDDKTVTGRVKYVEDLKVIPDVAKGITGNYFVIGLDRQNNNFDQVTFQYRNKIAVLGVIDSGRDDILLIPVLKSMAGAKLIIKQTRKSNKKVLFEETYDLSKIEADPAPPVKLFTVSVPDPKENFGGVTFGDMQDITINEDNSITGTVNYIKGLTVGGEKLNGSYCAIKVVSNDTDIDKTTIKYVNNLEVIGKIESGNDNTILLPPLESMAGARLIVSQSRNSSEVPDFEEIYDVSRLVFEPAPAKANLVSVSTADLSHSWKDVTYNQVMADDVQAVLGDDNEIKVTGTLLQKDGWTAYNKENQNKWYPVINFTVENDKQVIAFYKDDEVSSIHHFESGKPNDDVIFVIDNDTKNQVKKIKVYSSQSDAEEGFNGHEYRIDFSGCNLLTNVPAELQFEMADQGHSWKGVTYSDIQSKDSSLTVEKDTLKITGTFYKVNGWSAFGKKNQNKWYIATKVTRPSDAVVEGSDKRSFLADKVSDDIVYAFDSISSKPSFKVYPTAKHKELDFAGRTYTMDLSKVTLVDPYVKLSINTEKTYDIDDPTKLGTFEVGNGEITGTAKKYFGQIASRETKPDQQTGYYISVVADPWEGVSASKNGKDYVPMSDNGKVLVFLGQTENDVEKLYFKNTKVNNHIDEFNLNITCEKDDSIPSVDKVGYFAAKKELNTYLTDELHLSEDQMNVDDQIFYIHYNAPLDNATDYVTFVEVKDHKYGVAHKHVEAEETVTYFSMKNGFQVDYVDDAVKTKENSACDLTDYHGSAKVSLYRVNGAVDPNTYPSKMDKMVEYTVTIE